MSLFQVTKKQVIENYELRTITGDIASFTPSYSQLLPNPFSDLNVTTNVVATGGNGTPDNPIPINGYTEANITRCGVNLWDEEWEVGTINTNTGANNNTGERIRSKGYTTITPSTTYFLVYGGTVPSGAFTNICFYDENKDYLGSSTYVYRWLDSRNSTFNSPANAHFARFTVQDFTTVYSNNISFNEGNDTQYHPYNGNTYTIAFGDTYYGGVLDVTRGKLTVTHGYKIYNGTENWSLNSSSKPWLFSVSAPTDIKQGSAATLYEISNLFIATSEIWSYSGYGILNNFNNLLIGYPDANADIDALKTFLSNNNLQVCYQLETPFDIDLTPEVISAVVGTNNVFADCGETTVTCLI